MLTQEFNGFTSIDNEFTPTSRDEAAAPVALKPVLVRTHDGYLVDPETGEVHGHVEATERFMIDDDNKLEWALGKGMDLDAEIYALEMKRTAINEQIDRMQAQIEAKKSWWAARFMADIRRYAWDKLEGSKKRSLDTVFGRLSFRARAASIKIIDKEAALAWAKTNWPQAVKTVTTETVLVTPLKGLRLPADAFDVTEASSSFEDSSFEIDNNIGKVKGGAA